MNIIVPSQVKSSQLINFIKTKPVTANDLRVAAEFTLDTVANMLAGFNSETGRKFVSWAQPRGLLAVPGKAGFDAGRQAFVLGCLTHILEMDDLHRGSIVHPGCVVVPAVFALANDPLVDNFNGQRALEAVLFGYEATTRVGQAVGDQHYVVWHNTATCGPFGSTMAAAHLLGLNDEQTTHAFGNAGTQAAGFWEFLKTGAMSKHIHAGRGAEAGVVSAELAAHGVTGAPTILEGEKAFFKGMCADGDAARILDGPDDCWQVHATSIKPWPSCRHTHPAIKIALDAAEQLNVRGKSLNDIEEIEIKTYQAALNLCDRSQPQSLYEAKFSLQHCVAAALSLPRIEFSSFDTSARHQLAELCSRISVTKSDFYEDAYPSAWGSGLSLKLRDGAMLKIDTPNALGDPEAPLSRQGLVEKAEMLLSHGGVSSPKQLIDDILAMAQGGPIPALPFEQCLRNSV